MTAITITPQDVLNATGATVTEQQCTTALGLIAAATGLDLADVPDRATTRDLANLRLAAIWQAQYATTEASQRNPEVVSASANGASVSYGTAREGEAALGLSEIASLYLSRLSWRRRAGGISTTQVVPDTLTLVRGQDLVHDDGPPAWRPIGGAA